ncbi:MAG TPA: hypothetical protein V6D19_17435 [Stenomitos sp.]
MLKSVVRMFFALSTVMVLASCSEMPSGTASSGPASVTETSAVRANLADRVQFIEKYVTFRRKYKKLDYDVMYQNNGGGIVPGPSDWDIRLIAVVPSAEVKDWIPAGAKKIDASSPEWLKDLPGSIERDGIREWYRKSGTIVGIDRARSIIAYRNASTP